MTRRRTSTISAACVTALLASVAVLVAAPAPAGAATFGVTTTADGSDANPGNGTCATAGGQCTLRAAVEEAEANGVINDVIEVPAGTYSLTLGDIDITTSLFVTGAGATQTFIEPGNSQRAFTIGDSGGASSPISHLSDVTIRNGSLTSTNAGAALLVNENAHLNLSRSVLRDNQAGIAGGAVHNRGSLHVFSSEIRDNQIGSGNTTGGGVTSTGGGIYNAGTGNVHIEDTTIAGNESSRGGGIGNITGDVRIRNSTISGNSVYEGGGAIYNVGSSTASPGTTGILIISSSTITDNEANANTGSGKNRPWGGGIINLGGGQVSIGKTILAGNTDNRTDFSDEYSPDCYSVEEFRMTSFASNIIGVVNANCDTSTRVGDQFGTEAAPIDPRLGVLTFNGNVPRTHQPLSDSPAIDAAPVGGVTSFFECTAEDQRDVPRPLDSDLDGVDRCEIGSVERPPSDDGDGVPAAEEDAGPNGGDGNEDGIPDRWQPRVASVQASAPGLPYVVVTTGEEQVIDHVDGVPIPDDPPVQLFPIGAFDLVVIPDGDGEARVTIDLPPGVTATRWFKYGPEPGDPTDHWWSFVFTGSTGLAGFGGVITLDLVDGQRGDDDGVVNGRISDPGSPTKSLFCEMTEATIIGTPGPDDITGTAGPDVIVALGGDDTIHGLGGDDIICAGAGDDIVEAGSGDDIVNGGSGQDTIRGRDGADRLRGGLDDDLLIGDAGDDNLFGGDGDDELRGGAGDDTVTGWNGNDLLKGGADDDEIWGGEGDDTLSGWNGHDTLGGGPGDDTLYGGAGDDQLWGGPGTDTIRGGPGDDTAASGEDVVT